MCLVGHACNRGAPWVIVLHHDFCADKHCFCADYAFDLKCQVYCIALCLITFYVAHFSLLVSACFTSSSAHNTVHQLFTHYLPTIICVILLTIVNDFINIYILEVSTSMVRFHLPF